MSDESHREPIDIDEIADLLGDEKKPETPPVMEEKETPPPPPPADPVPPAQGPSFKWPRRLFLGLVGGIVLTGLVFLIYIATDLPPLDLIENPESDLSTQLISADGVVLQKFYSRENRVNRRLNQISPYVVNALIATEDARFYGHSGIDPKSFFSILKGVIFEDEIRGGSTITMQLARNLYDEVGREPTVIRKLKEYLVSAYIERRFTKQEIMAAYLNTVNIYGDSYGIETTANRLFNKSAKDLTIEESALVVGMLKGQGVYNPYRHVKRTEDRRNTIIEQMEKYGFLDAAKINVDSIKDIPLESTLAKQEQGHVKGLAPYFREIARQELAKWCKANGYDLYTSGLRVYTTLDSRMQAHAEAAVRSHIRALQKDFDRVEKRGKRALDKDPSIVIALKRQSYRYIAAKRNKKSDVEIDKEFRTKVPMTMFTWEGPVDTVMSPLDSIRTVARLLETGMVSIDPTNGHVKAWVGGIDYGFFKYDHVKKGKRQVGSTFKPFVYGAAVEAGIDPCEQFLNQPVTINIPGSGPWTPKNSGGEVGGKVTLRHALANSLNVVTARLIDRVSPEAVANFATRMGITSELDKVHSLALGTTDLSVMELANAYSTFASYGLRTETPLLVMRIEDRFGNVLEEFAPKQEQVLRPEDAYIIADLLKGVVDRGTGQRLRFKYKFTNDIGGKTGTTQNQSDGWFVGITPNLVTAVWVGHSDRRMHFRSIKYGQGANMALPIWALYMKGVYGDGRINLPQEPFTKPEGMENVSLYCRVKKTEEDIDFDSPDVDDPDSFE
ncbi:MAG: transglycosylase domain-containing protein [Bacteroidota bacterium]